MTKKVPQDDGLPDHWVPIQLLGASAMFQRAAREYAEEYARASLAAISAPEMPRDPVASAWFHRGMVNFDAEDALSVLDDGKGTPIKLYAIVAPAQPAWQPIDTCPSDRCVLLYSPELNPTNLERIDARVYHETRAGSRHAWATHWMPLPDGPNAALAGSAPLPPVPDHLTIAEACSATETIVQSYLDNYEFDDGEGAMYTPSELESTLINDAVHGLLADDEYVRANDAWRFAVHAAGRDAQTDDLREDCGLLAAHQGPALSLPKPEPAHFVKTLDCPACGFATYQPKPRESVKTRPVLQLPPLTDIMYHACRGNEYEFGGGPDTVTGYLDDDMLDEIWEQINTALRCAQVAAPPETPGHLGATGGWIAVKDRLPGHRESVLLNYDGKWIVGHRSERIGGWHSEYGHPLNDPSHWLPLSALPTAADPQGAPS